MSKITEATEIFVPKFHKLQDIFDKHARSHWVADEADMSQDVTQWKSGTISEVRKEFIKMVLRLFTQADTNVCSSYVERLLPVFKNADARMMLLSFADRECFDKDTEVLTNSGWKKFESLYKEDKVAEIDLADNSLYFSTPLEYIRKPYSGILHHYKSSRTDICVTPNHDIIVKHPTTKKVEKRKSGDGLWGRNYYYPSAGFASVGTDLTDMERLLIAIQADGSVRNSTPNYDRKGNTGIIFSLTKERKIKRLSALLAALGIMCTPTKKERGTIFNFSLPKDLVNYEDIKSFNWVDIGSMSGNKAKQFIEEALLWDGSGQYWYNTNKAAVDTMQAIGLLCGLTAGVSINREAGKYQVLNNKYESNIKTCYVLNFVNKSWKGYPYREEIPYNGDVFCVSMPRGTVVTRRNGIVAIQGNCTHVKAYKRLNDTLGYDSVAFMSEFLNYKAMADKHSFMIEEANMRSNKGIAEYLAKQVLMEGVSLFAPFAMLLNFSRHGILPGMVSVNQWSVIDESLHVEGLTELFKIFIEEHPSIINEDFKKNIYNTARTIVALEDEFIDLCYSIENMPKMPKQDLKDYIRFVCDYRMQQMGFKSQFGIEKNPLPFIEEITGDGIFGNFFESTITAYSKNSLAGEWIY